MLRARDMSRQCRGRDPEAVVTIQVPGRAQGHQLARARAAAARGSKAPKSCENQDLRRVAVDLGPLLPPAVAIGPPEAHALRRPWGRCVKRSTDLLVGSLLLVLAAPLLTLIAIGIGCSGRPILCRHQRIGRNGRPFVCFKFRTMAADADALLTEHLRQNPKAAEEWRRRHKLRDDPRITTLGMWLRRTSLDELPQLINVLCGEMSLVGPRPIVAEELVRYGDQGSYYLDVAPGLTGLWQVSGRHELDYRQRIQLDSWYVRNWSLWRDLVILLRTPLAVVNGRGAY